MPNFWAIAQKMDSSTVASQTFGIRRQIVFLATRKLYMRQGYFSPEARYLTVIAIFKPGEGAFLICVSVFVILGPTLCTNSSNMAGSILRKFKNAWGSSIRSSFIKRWKFPCNCALSANSQGRVWYLLGRGVARDGGTRGGILKVSPLFGPKIGEDQKKKLLPSN